MDLLLIGYGKMNRLVAEMGAERGHRVVKTIDGPADWSAGWSPGLVAIDFSAAEAVPDNVERCMSAGIPMVIGTTGWQAHLDRVRKLVEDSTAAAVHGANFSIGVHALYRAVAAAARTLPAGLAAGGGYDAFVVEAHHKQKLDAPSGTALRLAGVLADHGHPAASVVSVRAGAQPGTHTVGFDGADDALTLTHTARSRRGFAAGALLAAAWIPGRRGWFEFGAVLDALAHGDGPS